MLYFFFLISYFIQDKEVERNFSSLPTFPLEEIFLNICLIEYILSLIILGTVLRFTDKHQNLFDFNVVI